MFSFPTQSYQSTIPAFPQIHCLNPSHSNYPLALKSSERLINTKVQMAIFFTPPSSTTPIPSRSHHPLRLNSSEHTLAYCCSVIWMITTNGRNDIPVCNKPLASYLSQLFSVINTKEHCGQSSTLYPPLCLSLLPKGHLPRCILTNILGNQSAKPYLTLNSAYRVGVSNTRLKAG